MGCPRRFGLFTYSKRAQDYLELTQRFHAFRRLSTKRPAQGAVEVDPQRDRHFWGICGSRFWHRSSVASGGGSLPAKFMGDSFCLEKAWSLEPRFLFTCITIEFRTRSISTCLLPSGPIRKAITHRSNLFESIPAAFCPGVVAGTARVRHSQKLLAGIRVNFRLDP